jgi:hypothetical protein
MVVLLAMTTDLAAGSPAGRFFGESLANALAVYLLNRYTVRRYALVVYQGGLPGYRLKRVLEHIADNVADDLNPLATCCGCRHEPALLCRVVQAEHRSRSAPVCAIAENRARQTKPPQSQAQRH